MSSPNPEQFYSTTNTNEGEQINDNFLIDETKGEMFLSQSDLSSINGSITGTDGGKIFNSSVQSLIYFNSIQGMMKM